MRERMHDPFADQVACARYRPERDMLAQAMERVADDIERTFLGFEGAEDAPAMRWARGLREALGALHSPRSSHEDVEAARWVREHGGLDEVRRDFQDAYNRRSELYAALGIDLDTGWSDAMAELDRRLMPEGMEWPMFEDSEPVRPGDRLLDKDGDWFKAVSFVFTCDWWSIRGYQTEGFGDLNDKTRRTLEGMSYGARVKRPAPKTLDADGVEIRVGDVLYRKSDGHMVKVAEVYEKTFTDADDYVRPGDGYTHRAPVFAADVRPLHEGEHVYHVETGAELVVKKLPKPGEYQAVVAFAPPASHLMSFDPDQLTHERPDSWERLEEDATKNPFDYCKDVGHRLDTCENSEAYKARDLVRRARALAGVSER